MRAIAHIRHSRSATAKRPTAKPATDPRKKPRQARSQETVRVILNATARVLVKTGYDRASTNRIAEAAGVSVGSLYQYFPSKEALVAALAMRHKAEMKAIVRQKVGELVGAPLGHGVRELVKAIFEAIAVDPKLYKVLIEQVPRVGQLEHLIGVEEELQEIIRGALESRAKELRVQDFETAAFVLVNAVNGITHAMVRVNHRAPSIQRIVDEIAAMVMRYILP